MSIGHADAWYGEPAALVGLTGMSHPAFYMYCTYRYLKVLFHGQIYRFSLFTIKFLLSLSK